ncbi:MAG: zinc transport system permease protein [Bacteroidales bacterium]|jgi:zinc transport system permease protein|nr:zinc transport system permease protein [Bacteroidales bacterium]MDN5329297.1 zinc transport system permease protein [Bacteroidales bacterium]NLH51910.1 metal ABC transporter permease [Bacteroidales bacterium]
MTNLLGYTFFQHALLASLLSALICAFIGTYIVSRRLVFISGGITHASFGGMGIAYFLGFSPLMGAAVFAILSGFSIQWLSNRTEVREDSAIGIFWSLGMAIGIIFTFLTPGYAPNLMSSLFGSILSVSNDELLWMALLVMAIILFFVSFYRLILATAFDPDYASTHKIPVHFISYTLTILVALAIVLSIRVAGIILVLALLTIPPTTANLLTHRFNQMIGYSFLLGLAGNVVGLLVSYALNIPSGAAIILVHVLIFILVKGFLAIKPKSN